MAIKIVGDVGAAVFSLLLLYNIGAVQWPTVSTVMPSLPCYEMIRSGIFGPRIRVYYDITQLSFTLAGITLFGLLGLRDVRRYIVQEW